MKSRSHYHAALAAEYALGTLRGAARIQFEQKMQADPELAAEVARWQEAFTQLDNQITPVIPPASVWKRIQHNLALQPTRVPVTARRPVRAYMGWALAAGLAALLLIPRLLVQPQAPMPVAILASSNAPQAGQWVVSADRSTRSLLLTPINAQNIAADHSLELWAIAPGSKPHSLGLLNTQQPTQLALATNMPDAGFTLAISLEPRGGSPTGQPTGAVLYSGAMAL
ncbi:anti-sigma factor [Rahnella perminowiae]|uniref:anti-sigma factor n=1 Tax=Rahnella perminowiae TaxID=2816244 RepID=UPI001C25C913|nr:anti-sigma factor [Rahnella perminowiae]MBU9823668.1 anti-sigma factor [Rahnella perminowiae]